MAWQAAFARIQAMSIIHIAMLLLYAHRIGVVLWKNVLSTKVSEKDIFFNIVDAFELVLCFSSVVLLYVLYNAFCFLGLILSINLKGFVHTDI